MILRFADQIEISLTFRFSGIGILYIFFYMTAKFTK